VQDAGDDRDDSHREGDDNDRDSHAFTAESLPFPALWIVLWIDGVQVAAIGGFEEHLVAICPQPDGAGECKYRHGNREDGSHASLISQRVGGKRPGHSRRHRPALHRDQNCPSYATQHDVGRQPEVYPKHFKSGRHDSGLEQLQDLGLDVVNNVRLQNNVHNKGVIVDGHRVLVSSQNWSTDGTLYNRDAGLIIEHPDAAVYFQQIFDHDWENLAHQKANED
jgi:hypothetical protein